MKVSELESGMLLAPAGDNEVFVRIPSYAWSAGFPYLIVKTNHRPKWKRSLGIDTPVMYLGQRKDLNIEVTHKGPAFSNRFVMVNGEIAVVDPSAWRRMKAIK
jgi:hypothetical protein